MPATLEKPVEERHAPDFKKLFSKGVFVEYCQMPILNAVGLAMAVECC